LTKANARKTPGRLQEATGNEGVARLVAETPYSLGYVEFIYAFEQHLSLAAIRNAAGRFVQADLLSIAAAANTVAPAVEGSFNASITNAPAADAYPISTFSWLVFGDQLESGKRKAMMSFLEWMLTSGQKQCAALSYAALPKQLADREMAAFRRLTNGATSISVNLPSAPVMAR
jgi:phosphate transport system substrate-binding protein